MDIGRGPYLYLTKRPCKAASGPEKATKESVMFRAYGHVLNQTNERRSSYPARPSFVARLVAAWKGLPAF